MRGISKMPILIIFVDGFPYRYLEQTNFLKSISTQYKITPSFGYSVNLHAELFAGLRPDDVGYFGEWNFNLQQKNADWTCRIMAKLSFIRTISPFLDRVVHYVLSRYLNYDCGNIPFDLLHLFSRTGMYPLQGNWKHKTIFDEFDFTIIVPDFFPLPIGKKDKYSYIKSLEAMNIGKERIFISFPDLDGIAHNFGLDSPHYKEHIEWIDRNIERMYYRFLNIHPQGKVVILSDHGMATAKESVNLQLERKFGRLNPNKLVHFYDSLYLRVWVQDRSLKEEIIDFFQQSKVGHVLTEKERAFWGLSSPILGEIIFLLKEGYAFVPNYFGLRLQKAYHGYHPSLESQKCIFLYNKTWIENEPKYLIDVYNVLRRLIQS